jgi:hypothetical protein
MKTPDAHFLRPLPAFAGAALLAMLAACGGGGGSGSGANTATSMVTMSGTAASGKALSGAALSFVCSHGTATATADANGNYSATFTASPPCVITATANGIALHSLAFAGGTFNTTPETDLLLSYLAAQLGTTQVGLIAGFAGNSRFQQVLASQLDVSNAQSAVVASLQQRYALTLSTPAFLTTSFTAGQPGIDGDLDALEKAGAIDSNGQPDAAAVTLIATAGAGQPLPAPPSTTTPAGGTGNSGSTSVGMGGMM